MYVGIGLIRRRDECDHVVENKIKHNAFKDSWKACSPKKMAPVVPTRRCELSVGIGHIGAFASWSLTSFSTINIPLSIVVGPSRNIFC